MSTSLSRYLKPINYSQKQMEKGNKNIYLKQEAVKPIIEDNNVCPLKNFNLQRKNTFGEEFIGNILDKNLSFCNKLFQIAKYYIFPNITVITLTFLTQILINISPNTCGNTTVCICSHISERIVVTFSDIMGYWMLWISIIIFEMTTKISRIVFFLLSIIYIFLIYLFSEEKGFSWIPIYSFLLSIRLIRQILINKKTIIKETFVFIYSTQGSVLTLMINYLIYSFFHEDIKKIPNPWNEIFTFLYFLIFFIIVRHSMMKFGLFICEKKYPSKQKTFLLLTISRVSLIYLISFLSSPFLNFKYDNFTNYMVLYSYVNNLISLFTRFNLFEYTIFKIYSCCFRRKKCVESIISNSTPQQQKEDYVNKFISGCTLDVIFISSFRFIFLHIIPRNMVYSNCSQIHTEIHGIIIFVLANILVTIGIFSYMRFTKKTLFFYKGKIDLFFNIYYLYLINALFEETIAFFYDKIN